MKHYFYAIGAIFCWASLPAATGSGLAALSTEELMFFSFTSAAVFLYLQDVVLTRSTKLYIPGIKGSLLGGKSIVDGSISSQFLTGLLFALPKAKNDTILEVKGLKSKPYIDMTIEVLNNFAIKIADTKGY